MRALSMVVLLLAGCGTNPCKRDTVLLTVIFSGGAEAATAVDVQLSVDGGPPRTRTVAHKPSLTSGTIEIDFASGYPVGRLLGFTVVARAGDQILASAAGTLTAPLVCGALKIALAPAPPSGDDGGAGADLGVDAAMDAAGGDDQGEADLAPPVLTARLIAPMSTATVTSRRPRLRFTLSGGGSAEVDLCADRGCQTKLDIPTMVDAAGTNATPTADLPTGPVYWRVRTVRGAATAASAIWQLWVGPKSAPVDNSFGSVLDVNLDGFADVVAAASYGHSGGRVYLYMGSKSGLVVDPPVELDSRDGLVANFGRALANAGDVNGDGFPDLIIGSPGAKDPAGRNNVGRAYLFFGSATGLVTDHAQELDGLDGTNTNFPSAIAGVGDVNGDGYADVVAGVMNAPDKTITAGVGRAYLYFGGPNGLDTTAPKPLDLPDPHQPTVSSYFGGAVSGAGDVNGDGYADFIVGAAGATNGAGVAGVGRAFVFLGSADGVDPKLAILLEGQDGTPADFGAAVAGAGDVNGDGYTDVLVGDYNAKNAAGSDVGRAYLFLGGKSGVVTANPTVLDGRDGAFSQFGGVLASAGDLNGDGFSDVIVGARAANDAAGHPFAGRAYIYFGTSQGLDATPRLLDGRDGGGADFGSAAAGAGDVNGDGTPDVLIGAPNANDATGVQGVGRVYLFYDTAPTATPLEIDGRDGKYSEFGIPVARLERIRDRATTLGRIGRWRSRCRCRTWRRSRP
jgi:hypothetical protein